MITISTATNATNGRAIAVALNFGLHEIMNCNYTHNAILEVLMLANTYQFRGQIAGNCMLATMQASASCLACEIISDHTNNEFHLMSDELVIA